MNVGNVYTNTEWEKDRANQTFIENGWIAGEGLLGALVKGIHRLVAAVERCGNSNDDTTCLIDAGNEREAAWRELFVAMKGIELSESEGIGDERPRTDEEPREAAEVETEDKKFTMFDAEGIDLHASWVSYQVGEEGIVNIWIAELVGGHLAIVLIYEDGTRKRIGYHGAYTIRWSTEEAEAGTAAFAARREHSRWSTEKGEKDSDE